MFIKMVDGIGLADFCDRKNLRKIGCRGNKSTKSYFFNILFFFGCMYWSVFFIM